MFEKAWRWIGKSLKAAQFCRAAAWLCVAFGWMASGGMPASSAQQPPSVILISIDTLRADHLSAYGYRKLRTPNIDSFAQGGTLFTQVESQIPLTLPSHTSLLTSTYPFVNHVEENMERVPAGTVTLASVLRARGYRTGAFIGGYFLDRSFGLDRDFDVYDSPFAFRGHMPPTALALRRDGVWVLRAANQWLDQNAGHPAFLFVHLFDLHLPYERDREPGLSGYDTELRYVDGLLGRFKRQLIQRGIWDRSLVVLLSDHGESLGDHNEATHGYFIYQSTLWVPLIFHWPAGTPGTRETATEPAGLIDVAPTILEFLRVPSPASFEGRSLLRDAQAESMPVSRAIYSESVYGRDAFGWAALRGLRIGEYYYIQAPHSELYDLRSDPAERHNVLATHAAEEHSLENELGNMLRVSEAAPSAPPAGLSRERLEDLESLGYIAGGPPAVSELSKIDPKERLFEYRHYERALHGLQTGHFREAAATFKEILGKDPGNTVARLHLGESYLGAGRPKDALREWRALLSHNPGYAPAAQSLGEFWMEHKDYPRARARLEQALGAAPDNSQILLDLATTDKQLGRRSEALARAQAACKLAPSADCDRVLDSIKSMK